YPRDWPCRPSRARAFRSTAPAARSAAAARCPCRSLPATGRTAPPRTPRAGTRCRGSASTARRRSRASNRCRVRGASVRAPCYLTEFSSDSLAQVVLARFLAGDALEQALDLAPVRRLAVGPVADHLLLAAHVADQPMDR